LVSSITYVSPLERHCFSRSSAYSYESEFLQKLVNDKKIHEARAFNFTALEDISMEKFCKSRIIDR
jgi:hypothetical protein